MLNSTGAFLACNDCSIAMTDPEVLVDPMVEEKFDMAGRMLMGLHHEFSYKHPCDFCGIKTDNLIRWDQH